MKVTLIHNPSAGDANDAEHLRRLIRGAGHEVRYHSGADAGWEAILEEPADLVAVAGGDGTVTRVAKRLPGRGVPLAVLPQGTANNVARTLGVFDVPLADLVAGWERGRRRRYDLGTAHGPFGSVLFAEGVGLGLFAWTLPHADASPTIANLNDPQAKVAYAIQMLRERLRIYPAQSVRASLDDRDLSGEYVLLEAMNTRYIGPNLFLAPAAEIDDGCLDVVMVTEAERERFEAYLASWQRGWHRPPDLPCRRGRRLCIEWERYELHIDDELWPGELDGAGMAPGTIELRGGGPSVEVLLPPAT